MSKGTTDTVRVATFRRSPSGKIHMSQRTEADRPADARGVWAFVQTTGWWDGQDRIELRVDGEVMDRWGTTDAMEIEIFRRMLRESTQRMAPTRRPIP